MQFKRSVLYTVSTATLMFSAPFSNAEELWVGKVCPVSYQEENVGILVFSKEWYHSSRDNASYIPSDNATGIGLEIHLFANERGHLKGPNLAQCNRYRLLQVRSTTARLFDGEQAVQVDIPDDFNDPFYDNTPLEHGYGSHLTPVDDRDKPWQGQHSRTSTVAIYDTPYVSDAYGIEGENIDVTFETCVVCEREFRYDTILSCGTWGYTREYMGGLTGWAEPEFIGVQCKNDPSRIFQQVLDRSNRVDYSFWINWRISSQNLTN